ncbi:HAMP domain-containing histidine kinase [Cuneatibacter sp. NSJ-177]|uniref:sensor histidine kinase n=1 Tax=Cuneatibacter sp. NSJ-177 TaxID=2931401 RepID=UPI001FD5AC10|nr:HAMP domain-containing sensor histidine kinase [Cuneatibacter sp. NSJ-177]MCJ7834320.1 HAMP domain-containing histidine kinase [Cuneatibacter sp. NSJ-177]
MKFSIRFKFTMILVAVVTGVIAAICFINNRYLETYVINEKQDQIQSMRQAVETYVDNGYSDDQKQQLDRLSRINNIAVLVIQETSGFSGLGQVQYASSLEQQGFSLRLDSYLRGKGGPVISDIYTRGDNYVIYKAYDSQLGSNQIDCIGMYEDADYILSTPLESIRESVTLSNKFLAGVGALAVIAGAILMYFVTRNLTKPILKLAALSEQMAELDFSVRYPGGKKDEIGILGDSMNHMSEKLQYTIEELKKANGQLEKDIEEKDRIDERRREFISNVSHELKTPIALIQGYSEGLKDDVNDDPESRDFYCDVIIDEAKKMNHIVKRLLNLGEIESGGMKLTLEDFNLVEVIRGVMQATSVLGKDHDCEVTLSAPEELWVRADEFMLEEVLQNYLSNAYHYVSNPGKIQVKAESQNGLVRISVFNTGNPIPEEDLPHLWEKFYKVDKARTRKYGGSGIGLSIVKAIVNAHKGRCGVENKEDGVEFWFEF